MWIVERMRYRPTDRRTQPVIEVRWLENCTTVNEQDVKIHTKTKHIYKKFTNNRYTGTAIETLVQGNKQKARTIFLAQNGMLECGRTMEGTIPDICSECDETDDEQHRLSTCEMK